MNRRKNLLAICCTTLLLAACGGGGSDALGEEQGLATGGAAVSEGTGPSGGGASSALGAGRQIGQASWDKQAPKRSRKVQVNSAGALTEADTEYVLTQDIVANGTAFTLKASGITLDLNGHTITYGNGGGSSKAYGIEVPQGSYRDVAIVNGKIRQGQGATDANKAQTGWHPISIAPGVPGLKISGLRIEYRTPETSGIYAPWGKDGDISYNDIEDSGSTIINRHQLISVIKANRAPGMKIHHNRILRARQGGIDMGGGSAVYENEIRIDSHSTNSYGIVAFDVDGFTINNNTVVGTGEHPIGIGMVSKAKNGKVHGNRIEVQNTRSGAEYGQTGSAGMRMTWGTDKVEVWNNHITVKAQANLMGPGNDSWGRGLWVGLPDPKMNVLFRDNTIIAKNNDGKGKAAGIAVVCLNESPGLVFRNNLVVSNWGNVVMADNYGHSKGYPQFIGNTFRKEDNHSTYKTVKSDYKGYVSTGVFINNRYEGGASRESMDGQFDSRETKDIAFGWEYVLNVSAAGRGAAGASVKIFDNTGAQVFSGTTDEKGQIQAYLVEYWATNNTSSKAAGAVSRDVFGTYGNKIVKNPYTVEVTAGGGRKQEKFEITGNVNARMAL